MSGKNVVLCVSVAAVLEAIRVDPAQGCDADLSARRGPEQPHLDIGPLPHRGLRRISGPPTEPARAGHILPCLVDEGPARFAREVLGDRADFEEQEILLRRRHDVRISIVANIIITISISLLPNQQQL